MKLVNLTPHDIVIYQGDNIIATIPPSGVRAKVDVTYVETGHVEVLIQAADPSDPHRLEVVRVPVYEARFGELTGLPEPQEGVVYITSTIAAEAAAHLGRTDVVSPDTLRAVRDSGGRPIGVRGFIRPTRVEG